MQLEMERGGGGGLWFDLFVAICNHMVSSFPFPFFSSLSSSWCKEKFSDDVCCLGRHGLLGLQIPLFEESEESFLRSSLYGFLLIIGFFTTISGLAFSSSYISPLSLPHQ